MWYGTPANPFALILYRRSILIASVGRELKRRVAGSILGSAWLLLHPFLFLTIYAIVYLFILRIRLPGLATSEYLLTIFCGLIPFLAFAESLGAGISSIVDNSSLVRNTMFPIVLVPVRDVLVAHCAMLPGLIALWLAVLWLQGPNYWQLAVPALYGLQVLMTAGIVLALSAITVFVRDIANATPIFILMLMLLSPIAYTSEMVPEALRVIHYANPLAVLIDAYRGVFFGTGLDGVTTAYIMAVSGVFFLGGSWINWRLAPMFADYV